MDRAHPRNRSVLVSLLVGMTAVLSTGHASGHDGAKFEPLDGQRIHGVGNSSPDADAYSTALSAIDPAILPLVQKTYLSVKDPSVVNWDNWVDAYDGVVNEPGTLDKIRNQGRIPEVGVSISYKAARHYGLDDDLSLNGWADVTVALDGGGSVTLDVEEFFDGLVDAIDAYGDPVFIRLGLEFNWQGNQVSTFGKDMHAGHFPVAWRMIVDKFRAQGVDNAAFVWCALLDAGHSDWEATEPGGDWSWYPGDDYVDWFGGDAFKADAFRDLTLLDSCAFEDPPPAGCEDAALVDMLEGIEAFLDLAEAHGKPVMIAESSCIAGPGDGLPGHLSQTIMIENGIVSEPGPAFTEGKHDWTWWFAEYLNFAGRWPGLKALSYISTDWTTSQNWPHWKDSRVQTNDYILGKWADELALPNYLHQGAGAGTTPWMDYPGKQVEVGGDALVLTCVNVPAGASVVFLVAGAKLATSTTVGNTTGRYWLDDLGDPANILPIAATSIVDGVATLDLGVMTQASEGLVGYVQARVTGTGVGLPDDQPFLTGVQKIAVIAASGN